MSKRKPTTVRVHLTERALRDIAQIEQYSIEQFGKATAKRYLSDLEAAIHRLAEHPGLLTQTTDFHPSLHFYRSGRHVLVCDRQADGIVILTLLHATMDIPERLSELEPTLRAETELLNRKLQQAKKSSD
ncbi:Toxin ParE [Novipirellula aureliae]|uniref:Toxin ParE n=1 Tax=Novipirellula aureliae TaxID=2527966 RepID=A0A5C6EB01_9BACT|nr:type II toxin-antitoxin system RelE/ParE family toxin [Novipirellula aureliae]TWU44911.1 Toxin ParE [Novipirellula aureliae]